MTTEKTLDVLYSLYVENVLSDKREAQKEEASEALNNAIAAIRRTIRNKQITRISSLTGKTNTLSLPVTTAQLQSYESGEILLQNAFPQLTAPEREFIKSGITPDEWQKYFG